MEQLLLNRKALSTQGYAVADFVEDGAAEGSSALPFRGGG